MSSIPSAFNVYDVIGHWVPGVVLIALMLPLSPKLTGVVFETDSQSVVAIFGIAISYAVGFLLSAVAAFADRVWSRVFGFEGFRILKKNPDLRRALADRLTSRGVATNDSDISTMFTRAVAFCNGAGAAERIQRFYAASMLARGLSLSLAAGAVAYLFKAFGLSEMIPYGWLGIGCAVTAGIAWIRARAFSEYFAKEVLNRALLT